MATADCTSHVDQIGETAGLVWHTLNDLGPLSVTKLVKLIDAPRDVVLQAVGWLARENKLLIEDGGRSRIISLLESSP